TGPATEVLTAARGLGGPVAAVWLGAAAPGDAARAELGRFGVGTVHVPELDGLAPQLAPVATEAVAAVVAHSAPRAVLLVSTYAGKELAAGLAVALGSGAVVDADGVERRADRTLPAGQTEVGASWPAVCTVRRGAPVVALRPTGLAAGHAARAAARDVGPGP